MSSNAQTLRKVIQDSHRWTARVLKSYYYSQLLKIVESRRKDKWQCIKEVLRFLSIIPLFIRNLWGYLQTIWSTLLLVHRPVDKAHRPIQEPMNVRECSKGSKIKFKEAREHLFKMDYSVIVMELWQANNHRALRYCSLTPMVEGSFKPNFRQHAAELNQRKTRTSLYSLLPSQTTQTQDYMLHSMIEEVSQMVWILTLNSTVISQAKIHIEKMSSI